MDLSIPASHVNDEVLQALPKACAYVKKSRRHDCDDSVLLVIKPDYALLGVFDGVSGHAFARLASETALAAVREYVARHFNKKSSDLLLSEAIQEANFAISKGGTTACIALVLNDGRFYFAGVGDSHIYRFHRTGVQRLTREERESSSLTTYVSTRYVVTQCLGGLIHAIDQGHGQLSPGDSLFALTDGFTDNLYMEIDGSRIVDTSGRSDIAQLLTLSRSLKDGVQAFASEIKRRMQLEKESIRNGEIMFPKEDDAALVILKF